MGKSQTFGVVNRRSMPPDFSRLCWMRPLLYKLILDFAAKYVTVQYTSITINQNYKAKAHRDKGNRGDSFLVAFGNYTGGNLNILEGDMKGTYDVRTPLITDFSKVLHEVQEFAGDRYSLVFYTLEPRNYSTVEFLPTPSVVQVGAKYFFKRGDVMIKDGLPHPLKGRTLGITKTNEPVSIDFN